MLILFHPSGKAPRHLLAFVNPAVALNMVVVSCGTFRNTGVNSEDLEKEEELLARFRELLPQLESHVSHDPNRMIMGGTSGGAWRAFHYPAWVERPWLGIYSNGGWLGFERYWKLPYPKMRVAFVNGHQDHANTRVEPDSEILQNAAAKSASFPFKEDISEPPKKTPKMPWHGSWASTKCSLRNQKDR